MSEFHTTPLEKLEQTIRIWIQMSGEENLSADLSLPVHTQHGNCTTNIALRLAKVVSKNPIALAEELSTYIQREAGELIESVAVAGPGLVNIFLSAAAHKELLEMLSTENKDAFKITTDTDLHWVIEHTSPNPNKAMHLGHLRNNLVGMSLANLLETCGARVTRDCVDNNRGIAIAKAMYGFLALMRKDESLPITIGAWISGKDSWFTPEEKDMRPDVFVTECYIGGENLRKNDATGEIDIVIRQMVLDWENKDRDTWTLWQHILDYSYAGMEMTLQRLGNKWDKIWHEHEHYQAGKEYVELGLTKGIFKKLDDGAVLTQIEEAYNIPETILLKSDGTALYITQDIALTDLKKKEYNADKLVWVIGPEQTLAMQQLFAVCEQLEIGKRSDFIHIPYGYMGLKDEEGNFKKMASRDGTVLLIDDLLDTVKEKIGVSMGERLQVVEDPELTEKIALAATKFSILKCEKNMNMAFDINESINLTGDSGVYLLYTVARINSILKEGKNRGVDLTKAIISGNIAPIVTRKLHGYKIVLGNSREHLSVHPIAHYLLELASTFNSWYGQEKILDDSETMAEKLIILQSVKTTMEHGLTILGIETVEKM